MKLTPNLHRVVVLNTDRNSSQQLPSCGAVGGGIALLGPVVSLVHHVHNAVRFVVHIQGLQGTSAADNTLVSCQLPSVCSGTKIATIDIVFLVVLKYFCVTWDW